ncbi:MAG: hypothetical protein Edafosvirus5_46 [Edafosvirus sp.]|uniref:Cytidyltransferase-like domain-containing protein n=1 Tax=Edafosvirus sp. TaxID=2487765 RepID=A0A3G4ZTB7_9VIRU|nr:MAG: hypothetical protein Edafosvirus5_46 [Edafosvirus sp.]
MKIAIFGGAFDPITIAHIAVCNYLIEKKIVDEVWVSPCYISYYDKKMEHYDNRLEMCKIAVENNKNPKIKANDYEIANKLCGESVDIMEKFIADYKEHQLYFVIGMDNAIKIMTWTGWEKLINMLPFIIIPREGYVVDKNIWFQMTPHIYIKEYIANLISSTQARLELKNKGNTDLVDKLVVNYITDKQLYK